MSTYMSIKSNHALMHTAVQCTVARALLGAWNFGAVTNNVSAFSNYFKEMKFQTGDVRFTLKTARTSKNNPPANYLNMHPYFILKSKSSNYKGSHAFGHGFVLP